MDTAYHTNSVLCKYCHRFYYLHFELADCGNKIKHFEVCPHCHSVIGSGDTERIAVCTKTAFDDLGSE